jgi:hypothetical protein
MPAPHLNAFGTAAVSIRTPANRCKKSIYNLGFRPIGESLNGWGRALQTHPTKAGSAASDRGEQLRGDVRGRL